MGNNCQCANSDPIDEIDLSQQFFSRIRDKSEFKSPLKVIEVNPTQYTQETMESSETHQNYYIELFGVNKEALPSLSSLMSNKNSPLMFGKGKLVIQKLVPTMDTCLTILRRLRANNPINRPDIDEKFKDIGMIGPFELNNKVIYYGQFNKGQREGLGYQIWPDESLYEGYWLDDKAHYYGRMIFNDGDYYEGEWAADLMNGKGVFVSMSGFTYIGEFRDNEPDGQGEEKWTNGSHYRGQFKKGVKNGKGEFYFSNGTVYKGEFKNNKPNGTGKLKFTNGNNYEGEWNDSKMEGEGSYRWKGKAKFMGQFSNNLKNGKGELIFKTGKIIAGVWQNDRLIDDFEIKLKGLIYKFRLDGQGKLPEMDLLNLEEIKLFEKLQNETDRESLFTLN